MTSADRMPVRVLIVDAERESRNSLVQLLESEDFEVLAAASGTEGLELLRNTEGIAVVVAERNLPVMSGVDFLAHAWELEPDTLRIMMTCQEGIDIQHEALYRAGAFRCICRPWQNEEFIKCLRDAVATSSLLRENRRLTSRFSLKFSEKTDPRRQKTLSASF